MGKISLCVLLLLVPMRGTFEGMEGVVSGAQPPDTARISGRSGTGTASHQAAPLESTVTALTPGVTTAAPAEPAGNSADIPYIIVLLTFWLLTGFWFCYNMISPMMRRYPVRSRLVTTPAGMTSTSSDDDNEEDADSILSFSSDQEEAPEDDLHIQGLSSTNRRAPVVKFRRARPGRPNDPAVLSPPVDALDLLYQDLA